MQATVRDVSPWVARPTAAVPGMAARRRKDSVLPCASLASIQPNPSGELSSSHSAGVRR
jgi:hypothetical protein